MCGASSTAPGRSGRPSSPSTPSWPTPAPGGWRSSAARPAAPSGGSQPRRRTNPRSTARSPPWGGPRRDDASRGLRGATPLPGSITTADIGNLDWPVEGTIVYRFGRDTLPSGGIIRWNGVGISAPVGTPVHSVESGKVRLVGQFGTYGLTIVLEHGNGYYSVYSHLQTASVKLGGTISKGQTIGTVGGENSDYGAHLHFEIRGENQVALDPTEWLKKK